MENRSKVENDGRPKVGLGSGSVSRAAQATLESTRKRAISDYIAARLRKEGFGPMLVDKKTFARLVKKVEAYIAAECEAAIAMAAPRSGTGQ